jgi:hypothetical protein
VVQLAEKGLSIGISVLMASILLAQYAPALSEARDQLRRAVLRSTGEDIVRILTEAYIYALPKQYVIRVPSTLELRVLEGRLILSDNGLRYVSKLPIPVEDTSLLIQAPACIEGYPSTSKVLVRPCGDAHRDF